MSGEAHTNSSAGAPLLAQEPELPPGPSRHGLPAGSDGDAEATSERGSGGFLGGWFIWALTFSAGISGLLFGYDTGVISSTLVSIGTDLSNRELTTLDKSFITSCTSLFALISSPVGGLLGDKLGRKPVILIADVLFVIGSLIQACASHVWGMIVGRSLIGLAVGAASLITPLYISELSPSELRGRLVTILILFITGGQVVAYILGWLLSTKVSGWRIMVGAGGLPGLVQLAILLFLPETPRWLVKADRGREAKQILHRIYGASDTGGQGVEQIIRDIEREIIDEQEELNGLVPFESSTLSRLGAATQKWKGLFQIGCNRRALAIACMLQGLQQLCGFNSLMYFSATIFSMLSFSSPTLTSLSVAITNFVFTLIAFSIIDRVGRRRILLLSIPVMALALCLCALAFSSFDLPSAAKDSGAGGANAQSQQDTPSRLPAIMILISLVIYTAGYAIGLGNVAWQQSELFSLNVRSLGSALATATNWGSNFIVGLTFLPLMEWMSPGWTFILYAVVCAVGFCGVLRIYPEMSQLQLEEVRGLLSVGWGVQESLQRFASKAADGNT